MDNQLIPAGSNKGLSMISTLPKSLVLLLLKPGEPLNVHEFIREQSLITVASALKTPQLSRLNKESSGDLNFALSELLKFVKQLFNLPAEKNLSNIQISLLANDIRQRYWFLKFDELVYILREGVAGRWGKSYSRIDAETVHAWFQTYITTERDAIIEQIAHNEAAQFKKQENAPPQEVKPMPDHIRQDLESLRHKLERESQPGIKQQPKAPELTQEGAIQELSDLLPSLSLSEIEPLLKEAQMKQNRELVQLIEHHLTTRPAA